MSEKSHPETGTTGLQVEMDEKYPYLENMKVWVITLQDLVKKNGPNLFRYDQWQKGIIYGIKPEVVQEWPPEERLAYLKALGRLLAGMNIYNFNWQGMPFFQERLFGEARQLAAATPSRGRDALKNFLDIATRFIAHHADTNTAGGEGKLFYQCIEKVAPDYEKKYGTEARDALFNPFNLQLGTECFWYDENKQIIVSALISDITISDSGGLLVLDDQGEINDLKEVNDRLARGRLMLRNGENYFGGLEFFEDRLAPFQSGAVLKIDWKNPLGDEIHATEVKCLGTNVSDLEARYGKAYLRFMDSFPSDKPLVTVRFERPDGQPVQEQDVRKYFTKHYNVTKVS